MTATVNAEIVRVPRSAYNPGPGALALLPEPNHQMTWFSCREQFHGAVKPRKDRSFLFFHGVGERDRIVRFMDECQERIGLPAKYRLVFCDTDQPNVVYVRVGPWWAAQNVRISFLTALLRCGRSYTDDFQSALFSTTYTRETKPAVDRFLSGHTHYVGNGDQWQSTFSTYRERIDSAERSLVRDEEAEVSEEAMLEAKHIMAAGHESHDARVFSIARSLDKFYKSGIADNKQGMPRERKVQVFGEHIEE